MSFNFFTQRHFPLCRLLRLSSCNVWMRKRESPDDSSCFCSHSPLVFCSDTAGKCNSTATQAQVTHWIAILLETMLPLLSQSTNSILLKASNQHDRSVDKIKCSPCQQTFKTGIWFLSWGLGCDESPLGCAAWHRSRRATMPLVLQRAAEKLDGFEEEMLIVASGRWQ